MAGGVHIVAVGARTPLGMNAATSVAAARAGVSRLNEHPSIVDRVAEPIRMALDSVLPPDLMGRRRLIEMAASVLKEIAEQLPLGAVQHSPVPLLIGLPEVRPGWSPQDVDAVREQIRDGARRLGFGPVETVVGGHAAALKALHNAVARIAAGQAPLFAVVAVDSYLALGTIDWLDRNQQLATSYHRGAFFPGEGAGAFVVVSDSWTRRFGVKPLATVRGTGAATETHLIKTEAVCVGRGLSTCIDAALVSLRASGAAIDGVICDINGERYRSDEWGFAMLRLASAVTDPTAYLAPASLWGDIGAASGALFVAIAVEAGVRGWARGPQDLLWGSSEGGDRAAAVLQLDSPPQDGAM